MRTVMRTKRLPVTLTKIQNPKVEIKVAPQSDFNGGLVTGG